MTKLRLPVVYKDGQWESLYGGGIPVADGTLAELRLDPAEISDTAIRLLLTTPTRAKILHTGTPLCVAIKPSSDLPDALKACLLTQSTVQHQRTSKITPNHRFVQVHLGGPTKSQCQRGELAGGLWLLLRGHQAVGLESGTINTTAAGLIGPANSLNHAYTLISEQFESWRDSHTGNIYEHIFYQDDDQVWYPLNDLRDMELVKSERTLIRGLWNDLKAKLPADPFSVPPK